jgi:hypothetical protein
VITSSPSGACIVGGLLGLLLLGQQAMCDWHDDGIRYCDGYEAQR